VESSENRSANLKYRTNLLHHNNTEQYVLICRTYPALFRSDSVMFHDNRCVKILSCYNSVLLVNMLHFVPSDAVTFVFFLRRYQDTLLCCGSCAEVTVSTSSVARNLRQGGCVRPFSSLHFPHLPSLPFPSLSLEVGTPKYS